MHMFGNDKLARLAKGLMAATGLALAAMASGCVVVADNSLDASFFLSWETTDAHSGFSIDCLSVGADSVRVIADNLDTREQFVDIFDCRAGQGQTWLTTEGDYQVSVDLVRCGADASCLSQPVIAGTTLSEIFGVYSDGEYDLGHFVFEIP